MWKLLSRNDTTTTSSFDSNGTVVVPTTTSSSPAKGCTGLYAIDVSTSPVTATGSWDGRGELLVNMATVNSFMSVGAAALTHDLPVAFGTRVKNELRVGRITTVCLALVAAAVAQLSGSLVAFLGIFGWGLFGSTIVPALAIGLNWEGATAAGAIASIATGLIITLLGETLGFFKVYSLPVGVSVSALALVSSLLMFFAVSWLTRASAARTIDADILIVMHA